jgi:hypothetical protein
MGKIKINAIVSKAKRYFGKKWSKAKKKWNTVIGIHNRKTTTSVYINLSKWHRAKGDFLEAEKILLDCINKNRIHTEATETNSHSQSYLRLNTELFSLYKEQKKWDEAIVVGRALINADPNSEKYYRWVSRLYEKKNMKELETEYMRNSLELRLSPTLASVIKQIQESVKSEEAQISSNYKCLTGANNLGVIEHSLQDKIEIDTFITKVTENSKLGNEYLFYAKICERFPILKEFTPKLNHFTEVSGINFLTVEMLSGTHPSKKELKQILAVHTAITSIKHAEIVDLLPQQENVFRRNQPELAFFFQSMHDETINRGIFTWLQLEMRRRSYSPETTSLINKLKHLIIENKLYDSLKPDQNYSFMHGDFHSKNIIYNGSSSKVIDWSYCGTGPTGIDLVFLFRRFHFSFKQIEDLYLSNPETGGKLKTIEKVFFCYGLIITWFRYQEKRKIEGTDQNLALVIKCIENLVCELYETNNLTIVS